MPAIKEFSVSPRNANCGDTVTLRAVVEFVGPRRAVTVTFSIQSPCEFDNGATLVSVTKHGPSPQTINVIEPVRCPANDQFFTIITATATDTSGQDTDTRPLTVQC